MKMWVNTVAISMCVLLAIGGCQGGNKETKKAVSEPTKAAAVKTEVSVSVEKAETTTPAVTQTPMTTPAPVAPKPSGPPPRIKFETTIVDLKDMKPESKNTAAYTFTNVGKGTLKILDIVKTCGCTVPELAKRDYEPGESGTIKVEYTASKMAGEVNKHLFVMSNDPNNPKIEITLKGNIVLKVSVEPATVQLRLDTLDANMPAITIFSKDNKPFSIKGIESSGNVASADFDPNVSATKFVIKPKMDIEKLETNLNGYVRFRITHPDIDMVDIIYSTPSEFETQPAALIIRSATPLKVEQREVWVKNNYNKQFEIESVSAKNGYIKVMEQEKVGNLYKLKLDITPPELQKTMFFSDTLSIHIKGGRTLDVMCRGFYKK